MKISHAAIEKRLGKLEQALKAKNSAPMMPEFFYVFTDIKDVGAFKSDAEIKCRAMKPARYPAFVHFVGPEGGPELGTGPFTDDETVECHDDNLEGSQ